MDRAVIAYLLVALYGRCRHSDLQNVGGRWPLDFGDMIVGNMEVSTRNPQNCPVCGSEVETSAYSDSSGGASPVVSGFSAAKAAFENFGLEFEGRVGGPFFRPPGSDGNTHCRRGPDFT